MTSVNRFSASSCLTLAIAFAVTRPAAAQLAAYDPFNQQIGSLNGSASSGGGAVWPNSPQTWGPAYGNGGVVQAGSLTYGPLQTAGNLVRMSGFNGELNASFRSLGSDRGGAGNDIWLSFLMAGDSGGNQVLGLYLSGMSVAEFGTPGGKVFGMTMAGLATGGTPQTLLADPAVTASTGVSHFIAVHLQLGSGVPTNAVTMYVDPDFTSLGTGSTPTGGSTVNFNTAVNFSFNQVVLGNFSGTRSESYFDEIRIGNSWASVSPVPVPEPTGFVACGAAVVILFVARRRGTGTRTAAG
jgi:hypothetical protein